MPPRFRPVAPPGSPPSLSYLDRLRWVEVLNESADDAPGGALLRITGTTTGADEDGSGETDDYGVPTVGKPSADGQGGLLVAHPAGIPAGGRGLATSSDFVPVAYDDADTPAIGDTWGAAVGSWLLTSGQGGWRVAAEPVESQDLQLVEAWRRPDTAGGDDGGCREPLTFTVQVGTSFTLTTVSGTPVVTAITQRLRDVTVDENGCWTIGEPYCVAAGEDCDDGEVPGSPAYWCVDGTCVVVYDGTTPAGGVGPYASRSECSAGCGVGGGGGEPGDPGGVADCCDVERPEGLDSVMVTTLDGGHGSMNVIYDGSTYWVGHKTLDCGDAIWVRFDKTDCGVEYSCDGVTWVPTTSFGTATDCGPPFSLTGTFGCDLENPSAGCAGGCGTVSVTAIEEVP